MSGYTQSLIAHSSTATLVALILFVAPFVLFSLLARAGYRLALRPIRGYGRLPDLTEQAAETGVPLYLGLRAGGSGAGVESIAALTLYDYVSRQAARVDQGAPASVSDPITLLLAMNLLQANRERYQFHKSYRGAEIQFYGTDPLAYAVGASLEYTPRARRVREAERPTAVLAGHYEQEALWLGHVAGSALAPAITVSSEPTGAALLGVTADEATRLKAWPDSRVVSAAHGDTVAPGEDLFAGGAYLHRPVHEGSLVAQDWMRALIILLVLVAVVLTSLGYGS
jgi:hypothetical protein